jgi:hypothetical protein
MLLSHLLAFPHPASNLALIFFLAPHAVHFLIEYLLTNTKYLQSNHSLEEAAGCGLSGAKLAKLLKARPLCTLLATTGVTSQRELLLITLVSTKQHEARCMLHKAGT